MVAVLFDFPRAERRLLPYWAEVLVTTPGPGVVTSTSAQYGSSLRSARGKSKSTATIRVVISTETRCTQSNGSPRGSPSRISPISPRISSSSRARRRGARAGSTALRSKVWVGGSAVANAGASNSGGTSPMITPLAEEKCWKSRSTAITSP